MPTTERAKQEKRQIRQQQYSRVLLGSITTEDGAGIGQDWETIQDGKGRDCVDKEVSLRIIQSTHCKTKD